jgi:aminoglycoside 3-N-acetyltransferase
MKVHSGVSCRGGTAMSEKDAIDKMQNGPNTLTSLVRDFENLGLHKGMTVLVHSSLRSLGWVCGGAPAVALETVLTDTGTLVMPTHSGDLSDPAKWENPPVPCSWWDTIREEMPVFEENLTPTRGMGKIPETFRKQQSVVRSNHPQVSFAAWGKHKYCVVQDAKYDFSLSESSPLGRVYDLDGFVLLVGVDYSSNTSLHLAEYKAKYTTKKPVRNGFPVVEHGRRIWKEYEDIECRTDDFEEIGRCYERECDVRTGNVGNALCKLMRQRSLVDFAVKWMEGNR